MKNKKKLRDKFAALAMQALLHNEYQINSLNIVSSNIAAHSYLIADAMIVARDYVQGKPLRAGDVFVSTQIGGDYGDTYTIIDDCGELRLNWDKLNTPESASLIEDVDFSTLERL